MKIILTIALFLFAPFLTAEEKKEYQQYESILITPDYKNLSKLSDNMAKHNKKYHAKGAYQARVYNVVAGADIGKLYWIMGPSTFAHLDQRPSNNAHTQDWASNVMPYVTKLEHGEYWRFEEDMIIDNHKDWEKNPLTIWLIRYITVNPNQGNKIKDLHKQIKATIEKSGMAKFWGIMDNQLIQGNENGRHLMGITGLKTWSEIDDDWQFEKHFEQLYGKGSMKIFTETYNEVFKNAWNEVQVLNKKMSGME
ncbi:MAG: hypothetical protein Q9M92_00885 [Enterobacterales bacterium]|nr:hypothetical protein [Enterobacterales bacterium]